MEHQHHDKVVIRELLRELDELRELDRRRNAHAPGSAARDAASLEIDLRSRRLMDRFRDLDDQRAGSSVAEDRARTRPLDARDNLDREGGALLN